MAAAEALRAMMLSKSARRLISLFVPFDGLVDTICA